MARRKSSHSEQILVEALIVVLCEKVTYRRNVRPRFLKNPSTGHNLELDVYLPKLKLAFEVQGPHHFKDAAQKKRDALKVKLASVKGIKIICLRLNELRARQIWTHLHARAKELELSPWKVVQPLKDIKAGLISHHAQADAHSARLFKKYGAGPSLL